MSCKAKTKYKPMIFNISYLHKILQRKDGGNAVIEHEKHFTEPTITSPMEAIRQHLLRFLSITMPH